jgi:hypothetical protein
MTARTRRVLLAVVAAVLVAVVAWVVLDDDDDEVATTPATDTTTSVPTSTTTTEVAETTLTTSGPGAISDAEAATVVWPDPQGDLRYDDPLSAVAGFAEDLVGFDEPVYGEFQQGDSRSGEVEVRALVDGPVTTVFARQLSDDTWWVLGAATADIELDEPTAGQAIDDPLQLSGRARAFEGTVDVAVFERGDVEPLGEGVVTGSGGPDLGPFSGEVRWDNPGGGWGSVVLYTRSAENGQVWQATALPVGFIGGD